MVSSQDYSIAGPHKNSSTSTSQLKQLLEIPTANEKNSILNNATLIKLNGSFGEKSSLEHLANAASLVLKNNNINHHLGYYKEDQVYLNTSSNLLNTSNYFTPLTPPNSEGDCSSLNLQDNQNSFQGTSLNTELKQPSSLSLSQTTINSSNEKLINAHQLNSLPTSELISSSSNSLSNSLINSTSNHLVSTSSVIQLANPLTNPVVGQLNSNHNLMIKNDTTNYYDGKSTCTYNFNISNQPSNAIDSKTNSENLNLTQNEQKTSQQNSLSRSPNVKVIGKRRNNAELERRRIHFCNYSNCSKAYTKSSHLKAHQRIHTLVFSWLLNFKK